MTIWILALLLLAALAGLGFRQGMIRAAFSLVGILFAVLLAGPLSRPIALLLPHLGFHDRTTVWLLAPFIGFCIVITMVKSAGFFVHRKVEVYYKHKAGGLQLILWNRLNRRLGLCLGLLNGLLYLVLISFVIYDFSYWTVQIASGDDEPKSVQLLNRMGRDLESTGMAKVARAVDPMPEIYFKTADLAGLLYQNPQLHERLADYPLFISWAERDDFKQLGGDKDFQEEWKQHTAIGRLLGYDSAKAIRHNHDTADMIWNTVETNLDDLAGYLQTGQSAKYGSEKILGHWDINISTTFALLRQSRPNIPSAEMKSVRAWMMKAYAQTTFVAGGDGQAFLKSLPRLKVQPGQPPVTENSTWQGQWKNSDSNSYDLSLSSNNEKKPMTATLDGGRLTLKDDKNTLVFERD